MFEVKDMVSVNAAQDDELAFSFHIYQSS